MTRREPAAAGERYLETKINIRLSTYANIESRLRPTRCRHSARSLSVASARATSAHSSRRWPTTSPHTANKCLQAMEHVLRMAMVDGAITRNALDLVDALPAAQRKDIRPATLHQVLKIADATFPRYRAAVAVHRRNRTALQ